MSDFRQFSLANGKKQNKNMQILKIKRASLFLFGLALFFLPGQNCYLTLQPSQQPAVVQEIDTNFPLPAAYPVNFTGKNPPPLTAYSVLVLDQDSAVVLYQKNARSKLLPASTVKIMTALVALNYYQLDEILTVEDINWRGQNMELQEGEKISVRALLYGLLVGSANDAAQVLAKSYPGGEQAFVGVMNEKAKELNLFDTYFANPTGIDTDDAGNLLPDHSFTTTLDLARLTTQALRNPVFTQLVATPQIVVSDVSGEITHPLENINQLLGRIEGIKGVKTGWTEEAGECLVSFVERNGKGIMTVVLESEDRFGETAKLIEWVFTNYEWEKAEPIFIQSILD